MEDVEGEAPLNLSSTSKGNEELADVDGFLTYDNSEEDNSKANPSQNGTPVREVPEEQNNKKRKADLFDLDSPTHDNISETQISRITKRGRQIYLTWTPQPMTTFRRRKLVRNQEMRNLRIITATRHRGQT
eukprot:TRINITY_DN6722_c0_g1_i3.p1 TRINITY_DN6722_c0_g1~~TRINITY_DN6722_c0_g1_i3.p1  ORF type:complete len:131 (+),score=20.46 TRINITY_DN6722_c0_g1_i3:126-518(+)